MSENHRPEGWPYQINGSHQSISRPNNRMNDQSINNMLNESLVGRPAIHPNDRKYSDSLSPSSSFDSDQIDQFNNQAFNQSRNFHNQTRNQRYDQAIINSWGQSRSVDHSLTPTDYETSDDDSDNESVARSINPSINQSIIESDWSDSVFDCLLDGSVCCCSLLFPYIRWSLTITRWYNLSIRQSIDQSMEESHCDHSIVSYSVNQSDQSTNYSVNQSIRRSVSVKTACVFLLSLLVYTTLFAGVIFLFIYLNDAYPDIFSTEGVSVFSPTYTALLSTLIGLWVLLAIIAGCMRRKIRREYYIGGNFVEDCLMHAVCGFCAVAQEARHVDREMGLIV